MNVVSWLARGSGRFGGKLFFARARNRALRRCVGLRVYAAALALVAACAPELAEPTPHRSDLRVSEEVFRMFCMRVARDEHPTDPDGLAYEPACEGADVAVPNSPRLSALLARRKELVEALDQVFAEGEGTQVSGVDRFEPDELTDFLAQLIPYYDDLTLPKSTRALAGVAAQLLDPADERGQKVLDTFARMSPRRGYRALAEGLAAVRPILSYPRLDQLSQQLLGFVGEGGAAHAEFLEVLRAAALELAEPAEQVSAAELDQTTQHLATSLLFTEHASFASTSDPQAHFVRRDTRGDALRRDPGGPSLSPFPIYGSPDSAPRAADGRALSAPGSSETLHRYGDANRTLLAALLRDQKQLLERKAAAEPSSVEKLLRGVRPMLGAATKRSEPFTIRQADPLRALPASKGSLSFDGLDVEHSALLDFVNGLAQLLRYPETDRLLAALRELLDRDESAALGAVYAGLAVDRRADEPRHASAQLTGVDGKPGTPHEFWDDLIELGMRMAARPGLFRDVVAALSTPEGAAQGRMMARYMGFKDEIMYEGAPVTVGSDGRLSQADADLMNTPVSHELAQPVMRAAGGDVGMNRSLFQRYLSTVQATNRVSNCNKEGGTLGVSDPLTGTALRFPNPTVRATVCNGDLVCDTAAATAYAAIDLLCPLPAGASTQTFKACEFVEQLSGAETFARAILGKSEIKLKNVQLQCLVDGGLAGDLGATQEASSQIKGFTLKPTPEAIARYIHAPRNQWVKDMFDPFATLHQVPLADYEPNFLMALENKDSGTLVAGKPLSFFDASKGLVQAFDSHETFEDTPNGQLSRGGYLFLDLFSTLHMHWDSRRASDCPRTDADPACAGLGLSGKACNAGCTQGLDPARLFYSKQTNLVSYEPLLIEAFSDEQLGDLLALSTRALAKISIVCEDGVNRDGLTILGDFLERVLKPDPGLTSYATKRKYTKTNTCLGERVEPASGEGSCACPSGGQPIDAADPKSHCTMPNGTIVPRGRVLPQATPLHLVLDALQRLDEVFAEDAWKDRLKPWREARSALVDQFLSVNRQLDASDPNDLSKAIYTMANPRGRRIAIEVISFARERIKYYRDRKPENDDDLRAWAQGLPDRLASVLAHPLVARGLDLFEKLWADNGAGSPAEELARFNAYLLDPSQAKTFAGLALASADTLELSDRDRELSPAIQFAALVLADNAFEALDSLAGSAIQPQTEEGTAARTLEVTRKVAELSRGQAKASALSRLLKNAVLGDPRKQGRAPLETILDAIADVNRMDPSTASLTPHTAADNRAVFEQLQSFLADEERGLERLYRVIGSRTLK